MSKPTLAVIGGGGAGTVAAWQLSSKYDVTLFEAGSCLGGHAYSPAVKSGDTTHHIDMAVEYFNERLTPNLCQLFQQFGIESYVAPLTMHVEFGDGKAFWNNVSTNGELSEQLRKEFDQFHLDMAYVISAGEERFKKMSIGDFLDENGYSDDFKHKALLPLMTVYSGCDAPSLDYTLMYVAISFNMNLLSFFSPGYWRKAKGGIQGYIRKLTEVLGDRVRLNSPVEKVYVDGKQKVVCINGTEERFDTVVFATHADITLSMLQTQDAIYKERLGYFEYVPVKSYLHADRRWISENAEQSYCQFHNPNTDAKNSFGSLTRVNQHLPYYAQSEHPLLVTFDPKQPIDLALVDDQRDFKLPKLRPMDFYRKTLLKDIQGKDGMWFCGTDTSLTGHEGAIVSALVISDRLGVDFPFADNTLAYVQFKVIKDIMGVHKPSEKRAAWISDLIFNISKKLSLHKEQSHKFIKDLMV